MNTAQSAFAVLATVFVVTGAILLNAGENLAGWWLIILASLALISLGVMIFSTALAQRTSR